MEVICQDRLPFAPWLHPATRRLPGIQPLDMKEWLVRDEAFAAQMALRDRLIADRRQDVFAACEGSEDAAHEVLALVLSRLGPGYTRKGSAVLRPDGVRVDLDADHPLVTAARLVQEDLCLLDQNGGEGEHILTAAVLCFPASWHLDEKFGRPLTAIHDPVDSYTADMARRVQRLFDGVRLGRPMWRFITDLITLCRLEGPP